MANVAVRAAEFGLVCLDDRVGVQCVELARREVVRSAWRRQSGDGGGGLLLIPVVSHGAPSVDEVGGCLAVLARKHAGRRVPPPNGAILGGKRREQRAVNPVAVAGETAVPARVDRQR